jgi:hypothetical protein
VPVVALGLFVQVIPGEAVGTVRQADDALHLVGAGKRSEGR